MTKTAFCGWYVHGGNRHITKTLLVMKLTVFLLTAAILNVSAKGVSQQVTLSGKQLPLEKVFREVEKQTGYFILYSKEVLERGKPVDVEAANMPLTNFLDMVLKNQPLSYVIDSKTINISPYPSVVVSSDQQLNPPINISGTVKDSDGNPLAGANVRIKGTSKGVTTSSDGSFMLKDVDDNSVLEISYVGFETMTISVKGRGSLMISLNPKDNSMDELQVIAYGTTTRRFNTGNVTSVKASDIEKQPVSNPLLALQGRVPGLFITQNNGVPGGGVTVRIQGQNSIRNGNDPLYVVDGVPYIQQLLSTGASSDVLGNSGGQVSGGFVGVGNPLTYINPNDIESIEVLKDADATAIYGSRAANGAILITTKKGKSGQRKIDVNMQTGWGKVTRKMDMMDSRQYLDMRYEALQNDGINWLAPSYTSANDLKIYDTTRYTDWQKELIGGTSRYTNINTTISGGSDAFQYLLGGSYYKETTVFPGDFNDRKGGIHFNLNSGQSKQKFHFQLSGNYLFDDNQLPVSDVTEYAIRMEPIAPPLYNDDGSLNWQPNSSGTSTFINPIGDKLTNTYRNKTNNLVSNAVLSYRILPGLDFRNSVGYTYMQTNEFGFFPLEAKRPEDRANSTIGAQFGYRTISSWIIEPQLNFNRSICQGKLDILIGTTINQIKQNGYSLGATGFRTNAASSDIRSAATITARSSFNSVYKYNAGFARLNYNLRNRYILNLSVRRDGSSRFGPESQFHNFGSVGGAWIFTEESFFHRNLKFLSFGKVRASYGTTGNDQIGDYKFMNLFDPTFWGVAYQGTTGNAPREHNNPYLEWEETKKLSIGLDLGFIQDRILASVNYQRNRSANQLLSYNLPVSTGFSSVTTNLPATIQNTSWEFSLSTTNFKTKDFTWNSNFNLTVPRNELVNYPNLEKSNTSQFIVGQPITFIRAFNFLGVDPATGRYLVNDSSGNATPTPNFNRDRTQIITTNPKFYGGFQNSVNYKGIQIDFLFQFVKQIGYSYIFYNGNRSPGAFFRGLSNQPATVVNRWQKPGDDATVQKYSTTLSISSATSSDAAYKDASYIRLKNVSVSYNIPDKLIRSIKLNSCRVYVLGQNLLTFTEYEGLDPENQSLTSLPPLRVYTVGLQIGL